MTNTTSRRAFLLQSGALVAAGGLARAAEPAAIPIIDTHQHLWDLDQFRLPWLKGGDPLHRDFLMADYVRDAEDLGVVKTIYMEVDVDPAQHVAEAEYVIGVCRRGGTPMAGAVIGGRPGSEGFAAYLDRFRDEPAIKGVRQVLHGATPKGTCLEPRFVEGVRLLGERGLTFDLCMRPDDLADASRLAEACPGTTLVLDHCGNPKLDAPDNSTWRADIERLAGRPNVACKVSGISGSLKPGDPAVETLRPFVDHVLDAFGPDRVLFGGDWPVCTLGATLRDWVEALRTIVRDRDPIAQRKLFHDNSARLYRL